MNYIGEGVNRDFLDAIHRVATEADFFNICRTHLDHELPMTLEPGSEENDAG